MTTFDSIFGEKPAPRNPRKVSQPRSNIKQKNTATEKDEGKDLVTYLTWLGVRFTHIANELARFDYSMTSQGVRSGVPDYMIILPKKDNPKQSVLLFIELKRAKKSLTKVSTGQLEWINALNKIDNVHALVCYGSSEAIDVINKYMGIELEPF